MNGDAIEWAGIGSAECPAVDTYSLFKILIGHRSQSTWILDVKAFSGAGWKL